LTADQFFALTPRQFHVLTDAYEARRKYEEWHREFLNGIVAANIVNWSFSHPKRAAAPSDFMPSRITGKGKKSRRADPKAVVSGIRDWVDGLRKQGLVITKDKDGNVIER
jgi:hypothetical protein